MGRKIFITYGDSNYSKSLERIRKEAQECREFDEVIVYTDKDLGDGVKSSELFKYSRGGGYWLWKPYICLKTLERCDDTDIVVYSDGGNKIYRHRQWRTFWKWMEHHSAVFFYYCGYMGERCRRALIDSYLPNVPSLRRMYQIQGNIFILSKNALPVIKDWYDTMLSHPEYVLDATEEEVGSEYPEFIESRHDQSVLSCMVFKYWKSLNIFVTRQRSEKLHRGGQAIFNARISNDKVRTPMKYESVFKVLKRSLLGDPYRELKMLYYKQKIRS